MGMRQRDWRGRTLPRPAALIGSGFLRRKTEEPLLTAFRKLQSERAHIRRLFGRPFAGCEQQARPRPSQLPCHARRHFAGSRIGLRWANKLKHGRRFKRAQKMPAFSKYSKSRHEHNRCVP